MSENIEDMIEDDDVCYYCGSYDCDGYCDCET